jgi:hypothetical protein
VGSTCNEKEYCQNVKSRCKMKLAKGTRVQVHPRARVRKFGMPIAEAANVTSQ